MSNRQIQKPATKNKTYCQICKKPVKDAHRHMKATAHTVFASGPEFIKDPLELQKFITDIFSVKRR